MKLSYFLLSILLPAAMYSQNTLTGTVIDHTTNNPIANVNVVLEGTIFGDVTDSDGEFIIKDLPEGDYTLVAEYVGYETTAEKIEIKNEKSTRDILLRRSSFDLEEITVTGTKLNTRPEKVPQPVSLLTSEEITSKSAFNAGDLLDEVPGIRIIETGGYGRANGVSIRSLNGGPSSSKSLVLIDGRPVNNGVNGGVNWNMIPVETIESVEVIKGSSSALYGSQATAGVINVITKAPPSGWQTTLQGGIQINSSQEITDPDAEGFGRPSTSSRNFNLTTSYQEGETGHLLNLGYKTAKESFPTPNENDWENINLKYKLNYEFSEKFTTEIQADFHTEKWENLAERNPTNFNSEFYGLDLFTNYKLSGGVLKSRAYINYTDSKEKFLSNNSETGFSTYRVGLISYFSLPFSQLNSTLQIGFDSFYDNAELIDELAVFDMQFLGVDSVDIFDRRSGTVSTELADTYAGRYGSNSQTYSRSNIGLFLQYNQRISEDFGIVGGLRFDKYSNLDVVFTPKLGFTYQLFERSGITSTLKANYGQGFRAPNIRGLHSKSLNGYGNPDLEPEKTINYDIGLFQRLQGIGSFEVSYFKMNVFDLMINDKAGSTGAGNFVFVQNSSGNVDTLSFNYRKNLGDYSPTGVEFNFKLKPLTFLAVSGAYSYLDPKDFTFQTSNHRYNLRLQTFLDLLNNPFTASVNYKYTGDGYFFDFEQRPFDAFVLIDASISYSLSDKYKLTLFGENLTDKNYRLWHYAWMPGRTFTIQFETSF